MHISCRLTAPKLLCISLAGLTGCATTVQLEQLRAELANASDSCTRAASDIATTQKDLAELEQEMTAQQSATPASAQKSLANDISVRPTGYKWGAKKP